MIWDDQTYLACAILLVCMVMLGAILTIWLRHETEMGETTAKRMLRRVRRRRKRRL